MAASYGGDRLQELAQAWLVASLTQSSAIAVGWIGVLASIPQLLMPLGGVIADRLDRRRLLIAAQLIGAGAAIIIGLLDFTGKITPGHIYAWAVLSGFIWLVARPAYKVVLTQVVPLEQVRSGVALNSMSETLVTLVVNGLGALLLRIAGLPLAFLLNALSYLAAGRSLIKLPELSLAHIARQEGEPTSDIFAELRQGFRYLTARPGLLYPLLQTFLTVLVVSPTFSLLAAVVHKQGGTIVLLGALGAATSLGAFLGSIYAGSHSEGALTVRRYAFFGICSATALVLFSSIPINLFSALPLAAIGFLLYIEAVWNTGRVRFLADDAYQGRLQAITSMAFTLGGAAGALCGGILIDHIGLNGLWISAALLGIESMGVWIADIKKRLVPVPPG